MLKRREEPSRTPVAILKRREVPSGTPVAMLKKREMPSGTPVAMQRRSKKRKDPNYCKNPKATVAMHRPRLCRKLEEM